MINQRSFKCFIINLIPIIRFSSNLAANSDEEISEIEDATNASRFESRNEIESDEEGTDLSNNKSDSELVSPLNTSGSSEEEKTNAFKTKNTSRHLLRTTKNNRMQIPLRDRIRNLRHRRSLNLTQQTDYKNVLDSLKVTVTSNDTEKHTESQSKFFDRISFTQAVNNQKILNENSSRELNLEETDLNRPGTSASLLNNKQRLKSLNMQKRKIEMDRDESETDSESLSDENETREKVIFRKVKRNGNKSHASDRSNIDLEKSSE